MKIKKNFILQEVANEYLVVPIAEEADRLNGIIRLNETGAFLWNCLETGVNDTIEIEELLLQKYDIEQNRAHKDVSSFVERLSFLGCLE